MACSVLVVGAVGALLERTVFRRLQRISTVAILVGSLALAIVIQELLMLNWGKDALAVRAPFEGQVELGPVVISAYRFFLIDRKSPRLNSSYYCASPNASSP